MPNSGRQRQVGAILPSLVAAFVLLACSAGDVVPPDETRLSPLPTTTINSPDTTATTTGADPTGTASVVDSEPKPDEPGWIYFTRGAPSQIPTPFSAFAAQELVTRFEIARVRPDGTGLEVILEIANTDSLYPRINGFTPDGDLVLNTGVQRIEAISVATGDRRVIFEGVNLGSSSWSAHAPLAAVNVDSYINVYEVDRDGTISGEPILSVGPDPEQFSIGFANYFDQTPAFSPTNESILLPARHRAADGTVTSAQWVFRLADGEYRRVGGADRPGCVSLGGGRHVRWSDAAGRIAFAQACNDHARPDELWVMSPGEFERGVMAPDGGERLNLSYLIPGLGLGEYDSVTSVEWSPNGRNLVVDLLFDSGLVVLSADGSEAHRILDGSWVLSAIWGP